MRYEVWFDTEENIGIIVGLLEEYVDVKSVSQVGEDGEMVVLYEEL